MEIVAESFFFNGQREQGGGVTLSGVESLIDELIERIPNIIWDFNVRIAQFRHCTHSLDFIWEEKSGDSFKESLTIHVREKAKMANLAAYAYKAYAEKLQK